MNWLSMLSNPKVPAIKKMMYDFLKERYHRNDQIIERLISALQTEGDIQSFVKLMMDVYETGYMRSVEDHREQLKKAGLQVKIIAPQETSSNDG